MVSVISSDELKDHLGIDYVDDMTERNVNHAVNTANMYLVGALGDNCPTCDPRVKEVALLIAADVYDNRNTTSNAIVNSHMKQLVLDMCTQVRMEMRRRDGENI